MKKIIYSGECIETGEILKGSLIQFEDGTHTIMFQEKDGKGITSPVHPESIVPISLINGMEMYYKNAIINPEDFNPEAYKENPEKEAEDSIYYLLSLI